MVKRSGIGIGCAADPIDSCAHADSCNGSSMRGFLAKAMVVWLAAFRDHRSTPKLDWPDMMRPVDMQAVWQNRDMLFGSDGRFPMLCSGSSCSTTKKLNVRPGGGPMMQGFVMMYPPRRLRPVVERWLGLDSLCIWA